MFQLIYASRVRADIKAHELEDLIRQARENNAAHGITGLLLFNGQTFVQILEGDEADVRRLFRDIDRDPRHDNVTVLSEGSVDHRIFPSWRMGFYTGDADSMHTFLRQRASLPVAVDSRISDLLAAAS